MLTYMLIGVGLIAFALLTIWWSRQPELPPEAQAPPREEPEAAPARREQAAQPGTEEEEDEHDGPAVPFRVELLEVQDAAWHDPDEAEEAMATLEELGFRPIGSFQCPQMPKLRLAAFLDDGRRLQAAVFQAAEPRTFVDISARDLDGQWHCSTALASRGLDEPPTRVMHRDPEADIAGLVDALEAALPLERRDVLRAEDYAREFEESYAAEQDWRVERGGYTVEEVRRVVERQGASVSDDELRSIALGLTANVAEGVEDTIWTAFQASGVVDLGQPELAEANWLIVHDLLSREELIERLAWAVGRDTDDEDWLDSLDEMTADLKSRETFARGLEAAGSESRLELTGSFGTKPAIGDVYRQV